MRELSVKQVNPYLEKYIHTKFENREKLQSEENWMKKLSSFELEREIETISDLIDNHSISLENYFDSITYGSDEKFLSENELILQLLRDERWELLYDELQLLVEKRMVEEKELDGVDFIIEELIVESNTLHRLKEVLVGRIGYEEKVVLQ